MSSLAGSRTVDHGGSDGKLTSLSPQLTYRTLKNGIEVRWSAIDGAGGVCPIPSVEAMLWVGRLVSGNSALITRDGNLRFSLHSSWCEVTILRRVPRVGVMHYEFLIQSDAFDEFVSALRAVASGRT